MRHSFRISSFHSPPPLLTETRTKFFCFCQSQQTNYTLVPALFIQVVKSFSYLGLLLFSLRSFTVASFGQVKLSQFNVECHPKKRDPKMKGIVWYRIQNNELNTIRGNEITLLFYIPKAIIIVNSWPGNIYYYWGFQEFVYKMEDLISR